MKFYLFSHEGVPVKLNELQIASLHDHSSQAGYRLRLGYWHAD